MGEVHCYLLWYVVWLCFSCLSYNNFSMLFLLWMKLMYLDTAKFVLGVWIFCVKVFNFLFLKKKIKNLGECN